MMLSKIKDIAIVALIVGVFAHYYFVIQQQDKVQQTIIEQLEGKLSATARQLASLNDELMLVNSKLITQDQMNSMGDELLQNHQELQKFMVDTKAELKSYSTRLTKISVQLKEGSKKAELPQTAPSEFKDCMSNPNSCKPLPVEWASEHKVDGKSILSFKTPNLWEEGFSYDLNLAYNVEVITIGENCDTGSMGNQGVYIKAGYFEDNGKFKAIGESKLMKGDKGLDPKFILTPNCGKRIEIGGKKLFEPSIFGGVGYVYKSMGIFGGVSLLNLLEKGNLRLGLGANYSAKGLFSYGLVLNYYPVIVGKTLNVAPTIGIVWKDNGAPTYLLGLSFNIW